MKYLSLLTFFLLFINCKNTPEQNPEDLAIQNTKDGKVLLRIKPKVGDETNMMMKALVKTSGEEKISIDMGVNFHLKTTLAEDSLFSYTMDIQKINFHSNVGGIAIDYDSSEENTGFAALLDEQMKPILGNKFSFQMSDKAEIKSFQWKNENLDSPIDRKSFDNMTIPLPDEPVAVGDTWVKKLSSGNKDQEDPNVIFTLESITQEEVTISLKNEKTDPNQPTIAGSYILDRKTSFTKTGEINLSMDAEDLSTTMKVTFKAL